MEQGWICEEMGGNDQNILYKKNLKEFILKNPFKSHDQSNRGVEIAS